MDKSLRCAVLAFRFKSVMLEFPFHGPVDLIPAHPRTDRLDADFLCRQHGPVHILEGSRGLSLDHGPCHIAKIAALYILRENIEDDGGIRQNRTGALGVGIG